MATIDDNRRKLLELGAAQIPTGSFDVAPPSDGSQSSPLNNELGRNALNTLSALPGVGGAARAAASGVGMLATGASRAGPLASAVGPYAVPAGGAGALLAASGVGADTPRVAPAAAAPATTARETLMAPAQTRTDVQRGGSAVEAVSGPVGIDLGDGVRRVDSPGRSPLFTNLAPGADPGFDNRGQISARNMLAADALLQRGVDGVRNAMTREAQQKQYADEVAAAQATNAWVRDKFSPPTSGQRRERIAQLNDAGATLRTGMQEAGATARERLRDFREGERNEISRGTLDNQTEAAGVSNNRARLLLAAESAVASATTGEARASAMDRLRSLQGKDKQFQNRLVVVPGQKNADGSQDASTVYDTATGQPVQAQPGGVKLPPGMTRQVGTSGGKPVYEDGNGKRFIGG